MRKKNKFSYYERKIADLEAELQGKVGTQVERLSKERAKIELVGNYEKTLKGR